MGNITLAKHERGIILAMTIRRLVILTFALIGTVGCSKGNKLTGKCELGDPIEAATKRAGTQPDGSTVLMTGRRVNPKGAELLTGTFPIGASLSSQGILAVVNSAKEDRTLPSRVAVTAVAGERVTDEWQSVDFFDIAGKTHLYTLPIKSSFVGAVWHPSGATLYVAGGGLETVRRIAWNGAAAVTPAVELDGLGVFGYPTGLAIAPDGKTLYVTLLFRHAVVAIDLATGDEKARYTVESHPYQVELAPNLKRAYVSNWSTDTVSVLDLEFKQVFKTVRVGKNPTGIAISPDSAKIYVAIADEDKIAVIAADALTVSHYDIRETASDPEGISPTDIRISPDGQRLFVVAAQDNAVYVIDAADGRRLGALATGQYPTEVELTPDGKTVAMIGAKGRGAGPNRDAEFVGGNIRGTLHIREVPGDADLAAEAEEVRKNNNIMANIYSPACQNVKHPVPLQFGVPSDVIKHVVYIMRENKTYDSLLGDLGPEADGDPSLALFGEDITPNLHALARRFGNLLNFYLESEQSVQGHIWASTGLVNDFSEKMWIAFWGREGEVRLFVPGMEPGSVPKRGAMFEYLVSHGVDFRNHGEYLGVVLDAFGRTTDTSSTFPAYFGVDDSRKAEDFIHELETRGLPQFSFVLLGNNHTLGLSPGAPTPEYMIGDNDFATGRVVEAISKSPYWKDTAIFIFEDDPQGNADHIDAHRSICLVVSPWVKRAAQSRVAHSFPSLHKTLHLILGVPPMSQLFAQSAGIYDVFGIEPNNIEPYEAIPNPIPFARNPSLEEAEKTNPRLVPLIKESMDMDFSAYDKAPNLGRVLWQYRKGDVPFPEHLVSYDED